MIIETKYIIYKIKNVENMEFVKDTKDLHIYYNKNRAITVYLPEANFSFENGEQEWETFIKQLKIKLTPTIIESVISENKM